MEADGVLRSEWTELVPGGFLVYYADGDEEIIHANNNLIKLFECDDFDDFMAHTGGTFKGLVHRTDLPSTEDSIWGQVTTRDGLDHIHYRIQTKSGKTVVVDDYGRLVERPGERPVFYAFIMGMGIDNSVDWLTGLPSMERFLYVAGLEAEAMRERDEPGGLIIFDLMGMKAFNATYGIEEGDKVLCSFANVLRKQFGAELVCRHSGDSFCALAPLEILHEEVQTVFEEFEADNRGRNPPVMAGACEVEEGSDLSTVVDHAKQACDSDRTTWESHLSWYTQDMREHETLRAYVLENIDRAIAKGWIRPHYQPVIRSSTGRVCSAEALARWEDPKYGMLSPAQFVPVLEQANILRKLDFSIIDSVIHDLSRLIGEGRPVVPVSVNLSLREASQLNIASILSAACDEADVPHDLLRVEFTESNLDNDAGLLDEQIKALHAEGFEVWMDDFGSGYSSLTVLSEASFDGIKLDNAFASKGDVPRASVIVGGVIRSAKSVGVKTLAEGIETPELAQAMTSMGCDKLQGYHYFDPMPIDEFVSTTLDESGRGWEPLKEHAYWDTIGLVSLSDVTFGIKSDGEQIEGPLPAGVIELRGGSWYVVRSTPSLRDILVNKGRVAKGLDAAEFAGTSIQLSESLSDALRRCEGSGEWELLTGTLEAGTGFQFRIKPLCTCDDAHAYVIASVPTTLGSALGTYGDVPMGYAVLHMLYDEDGNATDAEYVFANHLFCEWGRFNEDTMVGMTLTDVAPDEAELWIEVCKRAVIGGETFQDVVFAEHAGHWLSYSIRPSDTPDHCIFAIALVDSEQRERQELIDAGNRDMLTGLLNRRGIDAEMERKIAQEPETPFTLTLIDVDDFKTVNDLYGHDVGDEALKHIANLLTETFPDGAVVGRNGGDEAMVALFGQDAKDTARYLKELVTSDITFDFRGCKYHLTISAGYAWCKRGADLHDAYTKADEALYAVKLAGKSNFMEWSPTMSEIPQRSLLGFTARELAEGMPLAMLAHRPDGTLLFANEGLAQLLGYETLQQGLEAVGSTLVGFMTPESMEHLETRVINGLNAEPDKPVETVLEVRRSDGTDLPVIYRARLSSTKKKGDIVFAYMVGKHPEE